MRRLFPIGLKLIAGAVVLVGTLTVTFALLADGMLQSVYQERADELRSQRVNDLRRRSREVGRHLGTTLRESLAVSEVQRLSRLLRDVARSEPEIHYAALSDEQGRILVRSDEDPVTTLERDERIQLTAPGLMGVRELVRDGMPIREVTFPITTRASASGRVLGALVIGWSLAELETQLADIAAQKSHDTSHARTLVLTAGGIAMVLGVLAAIVAGLRLSRPIRRLAGHARAISEGQLDVRSDVRTPDEIGELASSMNLMAERLGVLFDEIRRKTELEQELAVARQIQHDMLPERKVFDHPGLSFVGHVVPASHCGGDWWAYSPLTRQRTLVLVGDVTGHGISSAMLTATARSCLDTVRQLTRNDFRVGYLLRILDELLREGIGEEYHMTCFASVVDPVEGTLTYANAGHNQPLILRRGEEGGWRHGRLHARGNRLGDADGHAFVEHKVSVQAGDLICWYTDGLVEERSPRGGTFGLRRLRAALQRSVKEPPDDILKAVLGDLERFRDSRPLTDDITLVIGRYLG